MIRKNKSAKVLTGLFCLPTSAKAHVHEANRSTAFKAGQEMFVLSATQPIDQGGYPAQVVLTADEGVLDLALEDAVPTQHAEVRKNLPPRTVTGIVRADGSFEGVLPPKGLGLPHWEFISTNEDGSACQSDINDTQARMTSNKEQAKANKEAIRTAKKSAPATAAAAATAAE